MERMNEEICFEAGYQANPREHGLLYMLRTKLGGSADSTAL